MAKQNVGICSSEDCDRVEYATGLCTMHYQRKLRTGTTKRVKKPRRAVCVVDGCDKPRHSRYTQGLCTAHHDQLKQALDRSGPDPQIPRVLPKLKPLPADHPMRAALALPTELDRVDALLALKAGA